MDKINWVLSYWPYVIVGIAILVGYIINLFDKNIKVNRVGFVYTKMPVMQPIRIPTRDKGFWGAVWLWIFGSRQWELAEDFRFELRGLKYVIPKGFIFDGASIPKFIRNWLSPTGVLLIGGLIHDFMYKYEALLCKDKISVYCINSQNEADEIFRDINIDINGFFVLNYLAYYSLVLFGFFAWNKHRKNNLQVLSE